MKKVFLYGGCVIRDAYQLIRDEVGLSGYVARQSLVSAMYPRTTVLPEAKLDSAFQTRMVNGDIQSNLFPLMRRRKDETDLYVMDFHIERLGLQKLSDGSFVTRSFEMLNSEVLDSPGGQGQVVEIGSRHHTIAFTNAVNRFTRNITALGIKEKVLVINAPWAVEDDRGQPFEAWKEWPVEEISGAIESLTALFAERGVKVATMPRELAVGEADHKWSRTPFHFGEPAMQWVAEQIKSNL